VRDGFGGNEDEKMDSRPIGLFDSGVGGLSVLRKAVDLLPHEDILYFADSANCPYGERSLSQVRELSLGITRFLLSRGAKAVVVACNTASAAALHTLRRTFPAVPFVGMVPAVKPASAATRSGKVGVLATPATFQGRLFEDVVSRFATDVEVITQTCPGLVEKIEEGDLSGVETIALLERYISPLLERGVDTLVLGCTHYPFLIPQVREIVGERVRIMDPSLAVARQTRRVLSQANALKEDGRPGRRIFYTSGDLRRFAQAVDLLIGEGEPCIHARWQRSAQGLAIETD